MSGLRPPLISARLELRTFAAGDVDRLFAVFGDPRVMRFVGATRRASSRSALESGSPAAPL